MSEVTVPPELEDLAQEIDDVLVGHTLQDALNALAHVTALCILQGAETMDDAEQTSGEVAAVVLATVRDNPQLVGADSDCPSCSRKVLQ